MTENKAPRPAIALMKARVNLHKPYLALRAVLLDPRYATLLHTAILAGETALCLLIIRLVRFTNIDWKAYMQQVQTFQKGERDYRQISGDTGPLVYPAGFLWIYSLLSVATDAGQNVRLAQILFAALYVVTMGVVLRLYRYDRKIPPFAAIFLVLSKRLHSLYVLRLFNDCVAMLFLYLAIWALCAQRWRLGSALYSIALSVKMSVLLFAPAWGIIMLAGSGFRETLFSGIFAILGIQLSLAQPFLVHNWSAYLARAFEFSRAFRYKWTVNWRFVGSATFGSKGFAISLFIAHLCLLGVAVPLWCKPFGGFNTLVRRTYLYPQRPAGIRKLSAKYILCVFFTCNLAGMLVARSLHYQFYVWEAHQLVFLAWQTKWPIPIKLAILASIELGWETYPSTTASSLSLLFGHSILLLSALLHVNWYGLCS